MFRIYGKSPNDRTDEEKSSKFILFSQHLLRVCDVPDIVPGSGDLAPLGADNAQVASLSGDGFPGEKQSGEVAELSEKPQSLRDGMPRANVQEALGYEDWVLESDDSIGDQIRKASSC